MGNEASRMKTFSEPTLKAVTFHIDILAVIKEVDSMNSRGDDEQKKISTEPLSVTRKYDGEATAEILLLSLIQTHARTA